MFSSVISAIIDGILSAAINYLKGLQQRREDVKSGQAQQAAAETATSAKTSAAEAQTEASTDKTAVGLEGAARRGEF